MNIVIHTFEQAPQERKDNVEVLKTALSNNVYVYTGGTNACINWINILKVYKNDSLLLLEDDIRLCNDFLTNVNNAINQYPNYVLNFHYNEGNTVTKPVNTLRYTWNQCVYFPKEIVSKLIEPSEDFLKHYTYYVNKNDYAMQIRHALHKAGIKQFYAIEPKLVKSLNFVSTISNHTIATRNFIDE